MAAETAASSAAMLTASFYHIHRRQKYAAIIEVEYTRQGVELRNLPILAMMVTEGAYIYA
jgi:hypothetical protein